MSATFVAGQKLRAVDMVPQKLWTTSSTSDSSSITTTEAVISSMGTAPSSTYRAGRAYLISIRIRIQAAAGAQDAILTIRDTNASGTIRMAPVFFRIPAFTASTPFAIHYEHVVANTGGSDITSRVLVLTGDTTTNTWVADGEAAHPCYWSCLEMGVSTDYPEAVAL